MRRSAAIVVALAVALPAAEGEAAFEPVDDHPFFIAVVAVGSLGGLANSIGALVYAIDGRSFHAPWIGTTLFSSAICGAMAGQLIVDTVKDSNALNVGFMIGYLVLTVWPTAWLLRSALADVPLGKRFDSEVAAPETEDPIDALKPSSPPPPAATFFSLAF